MGHARNWTQQELRYCPHTSVSGEVGVKIKAGTCTSAGAADGTTLIDTNGDSGGADTYNGRYGVLIKSGACKDQFCRIVDDDGAGTLTFENGGFSAQIASGVEYEIRSIPDPCVVVDSSSGETNMVDAVRSEANTDDAPLWVGYYALPITGTHRGKKALITGFVPGTGTFTLAAAFGGALAAGDVVLLRKFVEVKGLSLPDGPTYFDRFQVRNNFSLGDGVVGARGGSCNFNSQITPNGTLSSSYANGSVLSGLFQAAGLEERVGTKTAIATGAPTSTTTSLSVTTGTLENLFVGQMIIWNGNASFVTALTDGGAGDDVITISPALPSVPAVGDAIYGSRMYAKTTSGDVYGCLIEAEIDGIRYTMTGCKGSVDLVDAPLPEFAWKFSVDNWWENNEAAPWNAGSAFTTAQPVMSHDRIFYIDSTKTDVGAITASPNTVVSPRNVQGSTGANGRSGFQVTDASKATMTFRELSDASAELTVVNRYNARTSMAVAAIFGSHGSTFAVRIPVGRIKEYPKNTNDNNLVAYPEVIQAQDAGTALEATTVVKVPDFAFHLT